MVVRGGTLWSAMVCGALALGTGCTNGEGNTPNVLPDLVEGTSSTTTMATAAMTMPTTTVDPSSGAQTESETESGTSFPATYRFDCVDIQGVGDADGTAFQAQLLEDTWRADIMNFKLNILLEVEARDEATGQAMLGIRSGIGMQAAGECTQPDTISDLIEVPYVASQTNWAPSDVDEECSVASSGTEGNTYSMSLSPQDVIYIYAEDDDTTPFSCTPDTRVPDAVPVRSISAEVSTNANESVISGTLSGCLLVTEATSLCSCLGTCGNDGPGDIQSDGPCEGCPSGAIQLSVLLGGVNPSANCTSIMGEDALDLKLGFTASRLPDVPVSCG